MMKRELTLDYYFHFLHALLLFKAAGLYIFCLACTHYFGIGHRSLLFYSLFSVTCITISSILVCKRGRNQFDQSGTFKKDNKVYVTAATGSESCFSRPTYSSSSDLVRELSNEPNLLVYTYTHKIIQSTAKIVRAITTM